MEEKEEIKEILNEIVEKVVNQVCVERVIVKPSSHERSEPWSGTSYGEEAPEYVSYSQCGVFRIPRRGIPPPRVPAKLRDLDMNSELYINEKDEQDEIIINVPEKYKNYKITQLGDAMLMKFLSEIHKIRENKLSLRGITLSRIPVLHIYDPDTENVRISSSMMKLPKMIRPKQKTGDKYSAVYTLNLNLGLNPYIYFNDYYISHINSTDLKGPIIILKRYLKYNPNIRDNLIPINFPTNLELKVGNFTSEGKKIIKERIFRTYSNDNWEDYNETVNVVAKGRMDKREGGALGGDYLVGFMLEELKEYKSECIFEHNKAKPIELSNKFEVSSDVDDENDDNLTIWKYGIKILKEEKYIEEKDRFEWLKTKRTREYELVKNYKKITDFEQIMVDESFYEEIEPILTICDNVDRGDERREYYKTFNDIGYHDIREKFMNKMKMLAGTSICIGDDYTYDKELELLTQENKKEGLKIKTKKSRLTNILLNYIADVQEYLFEGNDKKIRKYIKKDFLFDIIYDNENIYQELLNENIFKIMEKGLEIYEEEIINNEQFELQTPDIYILLGFHEFPSKFSRELWEECDFSNTYKWLWIIKSQAFLESTGWYYMYGLCCFFAQLIGPSYYLYNYYLIDKNEYCPNNSLTLNKFFAVAYYLVLYARMNSFWNSLTTTTWQYGNTPILSNDNFLRLTLIVNSICLCIIPLFTYTLFIELSSITDLILNCLTGEFLINIDNLIVEFIGEENFIKSITKDLLILSFIEKGFPKKNIMEGDSIELWSISALQVIQMFGTLMMTCIVYKCI